jgi:hypothetical protein
MWKSWIPEFTSVINRILQDVVGFGKGLCESFPKLYIAWVRTYPDAVLYVSTTGLMQFPDGGFIQIDADNSNLTLRFRSPPIISLNRPQSPQIQGKQVVHLKLISRPGKRD